MIKSNLVEKIDEYGDIHIDIEDVIQGLLEGTVPSNVYVDNNNEIEKYRKSCQQSNKTPLKLLNPIEHHLPPKEYLLSKSKSWMVPEEYFNIDIIDYLLERCSNEIEQIRMVNEMNEFINRDQVEILHVLIYLIDEMNKHNIVWGVGRGSSVACFIFYLIGLNRINPLDFDIDYKEFFKE